VGCKTPSSSSRQAGRQTSRGNVAQPLLQGSLIVVAAARLRTQLGLVLRSWAIAEKGRNMLAA
jgi:hypothetical protein